MTEKLLKSFFRQPAAGQAAKAPGRGGGGSAAPSPPRGLWFAAPGEGLRGSKRGRFMNEGGRGNRALVQEIPRGAEGHEGGCPDGLVLPQKKAGGRFFERSALLKCFEKCKGKTALWEINTCRRPCRPPLRQRLRLLRHPWDRACRPRRSRWSAPSRRQTRRFPAPNG